MLWPLPTAKQIAETPEAAYEASSRTAPLAIRSGLRPIVADTDDAASTVTTKDKARLVRRRKDGDRVSVVEDRRGNGRIRSAHDLRDDAIGGGDPLRLLRLRVRCGRAQHPSPIKARTDRTNPAVWRKGKPKTSRRINAVSIATSENRVCPPGRPEGDGRHASVAAAESHRVTSPRWTSARSYSRQFPTRYVVLYFGYTFDFISRIVRWPRPQDQPVDDAR